MSNDDIRSSLRTIGTNPAGNAENEISEGMNSAVSKKDSMESLTVTWGCSTFLTIFCC